MKALQAAGLVVGVLLNAAASAGAQPVGAPAIDERQGGRRDWAAFPSGDGARRGAAAFRGTVAAEQDPAAVEASLGLDAPARGRGAGLTRRDEGADGHGPPGSNAVGPDASPVECSRP